jgi:hypothetical protein
MCDDDVAALVVDNGSYFHPTIHLQKGLIHMDYNLWKFNRVQTIEKVIFERQFSRGIEKIAEAKDDSEK